MDTEILVDTQVEDGRRFLEQLVRDGFKVSVAFWVRKTEESLWHLYIASPSVDPKKVGESYRSVYSSLDRVPGSCVTPANMSLISDGSPIASDARLIRDRYPSRTSTLSGVTRLGDLPVKELYIYPPINPIRLSYRVTYHRQGESNNWRATIERGRKYEGINFKGAVSYSTAQWAGETPGQEKFAIVSVLLELDPQFDDEEMMYPEIQRLMGDQARTMADERFKAQLPEAVIEPVEEE
jgi:hypothetical protein